MPKLGAGGQLLSVASHSFIALIAHGSLHFVGFLPRELAPGNDQYVSVLNENTVCGLCARPTNCPLILAKPN
jgi:hypothetical protein